MKGDTTLETAQRSIATLLETAQLYVGDLYDIGALAKRVSLIKLAQTALAENWHEQEGGGDDCGHHPDDQCPECETCLKCASDDALIVDKLPKDADGDVMKPNRTYYWHKHGSVFSGIYTVFQTDPKAERLCDVRTWAPVFMHKTPRSRQGLGGEGGRR